MKIRVQQILSVIMVAAGVALTVAAAMPQDQSQQAPKKKTQPQQGQTDQQTDQKQQPADQPGDQQRRPAPILKGKVTLKSSKQTTDTASAGFNGVGPDGKVKEAMLAANPSEASRQKAARLSLAEVDLADVQTFAKDGKLNPPPAKSQKKGK
jgi:hypothetical protein